MKDFFKYCPICAQPLTEIREGGSKRMRCGACGFVQYRNPAPAAGVLVRNEEGGILLVKRRYDPFRGLWTMPAGFVEYGEQIEDTAIRELEEETGLTIEIAGIHTVESCRDDPRGDTILVLYEGIVTGGEPSAGDDAEDVEFFHPDNLPDIAFSCQRRILAGLAGDGSD